MEPLIDRLSKYSSLKVVLKIHQNKSKFLKIQKKRDQIFFSLHSFFITASDAVIKALVRYAQYKKAEDVFTVKRFVYTKQNELDLSHTVNKKKLIAKGKCFDLKQIYSTVNQTYFQNQMNLEICWFYPRYRTYRNITFGQYDRSLKLIKINHYLDREDTPLFFMEYLIYHEMLHEKSPPYIDSNGRYHIHTKEFKELERKHPSLQKSKQWQKEFLKRFWGINGRT